ncbi:hypothetical protein KUV80_07815 [Fictibacillus nanhaiensis]|uniref:hypothetical protein n=1 Tax=Fictibacillus nanhaiensis TaxID=742169 RepID=UPI001C94A31C|nr:hypothetical protein [Fictibacillus nanhaiensis]MBY6036554.1 hypothetical protein [Fictibacillus nanhaiensis]
MSIDNVRFKLELQEEKKSLSFLLLLVFAGLIISSIVLLVLGIGEQDEWTQQSIASQWAQAELQSNDSMKYILLSDQEKTPFIEEYAKTRGEKEVVYEFEAYDLIQYKRNNKDYIYKFHYYEMKSCSACQKNVWVRVVNQNGEWVIPDHHFTELKADSLINNIEGERIPTTLEQEEEMAREKSILHRFFQMFILNAVKNRT